MKTSHIVVLVLVLVAVYYFVIYRKKQEESPEVAQQLRTARLFGRPLGTAPSERRTFNNRFDAISYWKKKGGTGAGCSFIELGGNQFEISGC